MEVREGDCEISSRPLTARTGKHSCLLAGGVGAKIRLTQNRELEPGRYRVTAYLRGLDIGTGTYNATTEFMFGNKYIQLQKNGTFGWTKLTYVGETKEKKQAGPSFGMMAPGYFWIDDVSLEQVGPNVTLTEAPILDPEEAPIAPPGEITAGATRCSKCGYRNNRTWENLLRLWNSCSNRRGTVCSRPDRQPIALFRKNGTRFPVVLWLKCIATSGRKALRIDKSYVSLDQPQNWLGYDFLKLPTCVHRRAKADESERGGSRHRDQGLLDPSELHHRRAPRSEHLDNPCETTVRRGGEVEAPGRMLNLECDYQAGLRDRRQPSRPALPRQPPP